MQNSRRYCVTARDKIAEENRQLINRIGKSQFNDLERTHGVKITAQNLYDVFLPILYWIRFVRFSKIWATTASPSRLSAQQRKECTNFSTIKNIKPF